MTETPGPSRTSKAPVSLKLMAGFAMAGWLALLLIFFVQEGDSPFLVSLRSLCMSFFVGSQIAVALSYILFRALSSARREGWPSFGLYSAAPTAALLLVLSFLSFRGAVHLLQRSDPVDDLLALQAGLRAERAQRFHYTRHRRFADSLEDLLAFEENISESPKITFKFYDVNESGYFFVTHVAGSAVTYPFSNKGYRPFGDVKIRWMTSPGEKKK